MIQLFTVGLSSCGKPICEDLFKRYSEAGIGLMEVSMDKDDCDAFDYLKAASLSKRYGVELWSFHLPFMPFNEIDISLPGVREHSVSYLSDMIKRGSDVGIKRFIIHPSGEPIPEVKRSERLRTACSSLSELAEVAACCGSVIAVENLPRTCLGNTSEEMLILLGADERLAACFDTNHLLKESHSDFIRAVGSRFITTHISDYDFVDEKHWLPGEGKIDWLQLTELLKSVDYRGPWLYELGFNSSSAPRSRVLECIDFVNNAAEIFSGKKPTII